MRLSTKITLVFSAIILLAMTVLSSFAITVSVQGANRYTEARFKNMAASISRDLENNISMMNLTLDEMCKNTSFISALNQMLRDDTEEQKMGKSATKAALQQLYQSPLVDNYFRVAFYTRDGIYITSHADKDESIISGSREARQLFSTLPWLDEADETKKFLILPPHDDKLITHASHQIYGIVRPLYYHEKQIGYLEISSQVDELNRVMNFVDSEDIIVEAYLSDGEMLYSNVSGSPVFQGAAREKYIKAQAEDGREYYLIRTGIPSLGIDLYIAQDSAINEQANISLRVDAISQVMLILIPALLLIILVSHSMTRSIRLFTQKVRSLPPERVIGRGKEPPKELTQMVAAPRDQEIHELEHVFNEMMLTLRQSAATEMSLRDSALQAQLSALQTQINPHFIYNTLNIISAKAMESDNFDIIEICDQFAQMLRYSTDTRSTTATLHEEIENVRNYLMLAKARYEDNLDFFISVPDTIASVTVPKLTLQPLVENALTHGFNGKNELRRLTITGATRDGILTLKIHDNGTGFSDESMARLRGRIEAVENGELTLDDLGGHIGLTNTCLRLYYYSKGTMHMSIHNDNGAVILLTMPVSPMQ